MANSTIPPTQPSTWYIDSYRLLPCENKKKRFAQSNFEKKNQNFKIYVYFYNS